MLYDGCSSNAVGQNKAWISSKVDIKNAIFFGLSAIDFITLGESTSLFFFLNFLSPASLFINFFKLLHLLSNFSPFQAPVLMLSI